MSQYQDLQKQIKTHARRLQKLKERQASQGIQTDPSVITEIEDIEMALVTLNAELEGMSDEPAEASPTSIPSPPVSQQTNIGSVNISDISGSNINVGNIDASTTAGGDIVAGDNITHIHQAPTPTLPFGTAPPPPKLFVGRKNDIAELQRRLTSEDKTTLLTAVRGWPGIGKTSLAATIAHDTTLNTVFSDGVLWTALGPQPSLEAELGNWLTALGLNPRDFPTLEARSSRLVAILRHKKTLLIVDDVWEAAHAQPFLVGGRDCRTLITTREPEVTRALGLQKQAIYKLLVLSEDESLHLLQELVPEAVKLNLEGTRRLTHELEGLPLALHVAGRLLASEVEMGWGVADLLTELAEGARLLKELAPADRTDLATQTTPTIAALLENSTNRLDPITRKHFALLGHFVSKPATFDAPAVAATWDVDDPKPTLRELVKRGLVEPAPGGRFQIHALLVVHAKSMWETKG